MRVRDVGGVPDALTAPPEGEVHHDARVLPGGEMVVFTIDPVEGGRRVALLSVESGEYVPLTEGEDPEYVEGGFLLVRRGNALWAAALDPAERRLAGEPVPVLEGVRAGSFYSVSRDGTLVYVAGVALEGDARLAVVGLDGGRQLLPLAPRDIPQVVWFPDGRTVAFVSDGQVYTYDTVLNTTPRTSTSTALRASSGRALSTTSATARAAPRGERSGSRRSTARACRSGRAPRYSPPRTTRLPVGATSEPRTAPRR